MREPFSGLKKAEDPKPHVGTFISPRGPLCLHVCAYVNEGCVCVSVTHTYIFKGFTSSLLKQTRRSTSSIMAALYSKVSTRSQFTFI